MAALTFPLTKKKLHAAFEDLHPSLVEVRRWPGWHEAVVDGAWTLSRLRRHFKTIGFKAVQRKDDLIFVNHTADIGVLLFGVRQDRNTRKWKTYALEVQARSGPSVRSPAHFA